MTAETMAEDRADAGGHRAAGRRGARRPRAAGVAGALVLAAVLAVLLHAPTPVRALLVAAAVAVVARVGARRRGRGRGRADAVLLAVGGAVVATVLTGVVLDLLRIPLGETSWTLSLAVVGLAVLVADVARPPVEVEPRATPVGGSPAATRAGGRLAVWGALVAVVVAVSVHASVRSLSSLEGPSFEASLVSVEGVSARVLISSEAGTGPLEIRSDPGTGSTLSYPVLEVPAGGSTTTEVLVPERGRTTITVSDPGRAQPLRTLVVDR
ncbi:hypothetical protein [uncultured Pseudokineococcus sp.]|uniref:hypothetical protein n=1 Tax=uncultured Pseudokineococcus sp. TaxID=1642928 RepID=UPI002603D2E5|nr:hypothetical protein [uncultured Pseudokineococcus sp.]